MGNKRELILDRALQLWARDGVGNTSMRELADCCNLNVAALYHYFPSKQALLRTVIDEHHYGDQLDQTQPPHADDPVDEIVGIVTLLYEGARDERPIWRLLVGESCRDNADAQMVANDLVEAIEQTVARWLTDSKMPLAVSPTDAASLVVEQLLALMMGDLLRPDVLTGSSAEDRGRLLAECVLDRGRPNG